MKKNVFVSVYIVFVILVFIGSLLFSGLSVTSQYKKASKGIDSKFDGLCMDLKKSFEKQNLFNMKEQIDSAIKDYSDYSYINIKINGTNYFLYPDNALDSPESSNFVVNKTKSFKAGDLNIFVNASIYTLSPATIAYYSKFAFTIILIFTILTIMLIVYLGLTSENKQEYSEINEEDTPDVNAKDEMTIESVENEENNTESSGSDETAKEDIIQENPETNVPIENETKPLEEIETLEPENNENSKNEKIEIEKVVLPVEDFKPAETDLDENTNPKGLFSPDTGFGWESYLFTRLENELVRASSSEFDLCLFVLKLQNVDRSSDKMKEIAKVIIDYFQFKDLVFEYKDDCLVAIKTNTTIDDAIPAADNLYSNISGLLSENEKCYIGLSSKTIRLVGAERMMKEAEAALNHAIEEPDCPIIAFRANAEKYMEFLDNN